MVDITATIEHDSVDALCLSAFCNQLADLAGSFLVAGGAFKILLIGSGGICGSKWRRGWGRGSVLPNVQCTVYKIRSAGAAVWLQSRFAVCDLADGAQRLRHAVK